MTEAEILAEAEARANMNNDQPDGVPTDEDFERAEAEVRAEAEQTEDAEDAAEDAEEIEGIPPLDIPMTDCEITIMVTVADVEDMDQALGAASSNLMRYGLDNFYTMVTDSTTGKRWVIHQGLAIPAESFSAEE